MNNLIVKVQLSISTSHNKRQCLIYNEDRSLLQEFEAPPALLKIMGGADKKYFNASLTLGELSINEPTQEQNW